MRMPLLIALLILSVSVTSAGVVYTQPPSASGGFYHSSWWDPDGSDYDQYVWDSFTLLSNQSIVRIEWRGAYDPSYFGYGGPVLDFTVAIYPSIGGGSQPNVVGPPLVDYTVGGNAGQTYAGVFGGVTMYDYGYTLPVPFNAQAGVNYWVQIEAWQHGIPDWSIATGTNGTGSYFRRIAYVGDWYFQIVPGDAAFTLLTPGFDCSGVSNCSGHGACVGTNTCACTTGWMGPDCATPSCAGVADCSGQGTCIGPNACQCNPGWSGADCSIPNLVAAGRIPDGPTGPPLLVTSAGAGLVTLSWGASCVATDTDYAVYEGTLGAFYTHDPALCSTAGPMSVTFAPLPGNRYFLVVPNNGSMEGSYGLDSFGFERPASLLSCMPQMIATCP